MAPKSECGLSKTAGGAPLSSACAANLRREAAFWWDQSGDLGYGCLIPNTAASLFLNVRASALAVASDKTCGSSGAGPGSPAPIYISGISQIKR